MIKRYLDHFRTDLFLFIVTNVLKMEEDSMKFSNQGYFKKTMQLLSLKEERRLLKCYKIWNWKSIWKRAS